MLYFLILDIFFMIPIVSLHGANAVFFNDSSYGIRDGSCRLRSVRQAVDPSPGRGMTESFVLDDVEYKLCRYHVTWDEALVFCSTHKAHLATLDNEEKAAFVVQAIASSSSVAEDYWIGARKYYGDLWTWDSSSKRLSAETEIIGNVPIWYPGDGADDAHCLTIDRRGHDSPIFVPRSCNQRRGFICQRDNEITYDNKIRMVAATQIGEQEFRLYSGRTTWAEAVVQCRQEGLQIGEVNTVEEARALAVSMLRNRPEGIESVWIGGYMGNHDPGTWRWLASGQKVPNNEMWGKNLSESSGGCLLLDRHLCETPVYVETTCDRKRDVMCQKPPKKQLRRKPVEVIVDDCLYWIGFYPLKWSEARRSCESVNASLIVLDSPRTIAHVMSLMMDDRAELRHIWTDGRRTKKYGKWQWVSTGETIQDLSETFIPWCPDDNKYPNGTDCLNLDRENTHSPLVYGLSCNERQSYICQPRIGDYVSQHHSTIIENQRKTIASTASTTLTSFLTLSSFSEGTETLQHSTVTGTYPIVNDNYPTISTSIHDNTSSHHEGDNIFHWKPGERISSKNSTLGNNLTRYLTPLSRFTLPSFPQFGIKVVSAHETSTNSLLNYETKKTKKMKQFLSTKSIISPSVFSASTISSTLKNSPLDARKASQVLSKSSNHSSATSYLGGFAEPTISNNSKKKIFNSHLKPTTRVTSLDSKNLNLTKIGKISVTPEEAFSSSNSQRGRTRNYSVKTTRDLNFNVTKITSIASTKSPDFNIFSHDEKSTTMMIPSLSTSRIFEVRIVTRGTKSQADHFSPNSLKLITTPLPGKRKKIRFTTEITTPYDAIDEDYYDNYESKDSKRREKLKNEENYDEANVEMDEYAENYDRETDEKLPSAKKMKQTSTSNFRKSYTTAKSFERGKLSKSKKMEKNEKTAIPITRELSENLQTALITILKKGMETRKMVSKVDSVTSSTIMAETTNIPTEMTVGRKYNTTEKLSKMKSMTENFSLPPYYAFEGPMIVGFSEDVNFTPNAEKIEVNGKIRQFEFIGQKMRSDPTNFSNDNKFDVSRLNENAARRSNIQGSLKNKNVPNNIPLSLSGLPAIRPDDPNSLMQMGRYFKNRFGNIVSNGEEMSEKIGRDEYERYLKNERNEQPRWLPRVRGQNIGLRGETFGKNRERFPLSRDEEFRGNIRRYDSTNNYESAARRLYPRGDYDFFVTSHTPRQKAPKDIDDRSRREEQERLSVSWPRRNFTNSQFSNIDESQVVSPRNFPAPIRTTRSFNDDSEILKKKSLNMAPFPNFKISKLIKEIKIDLDQRLLRNYLEGLAKKIVQKESSRYEKNDWKDTWRYLLDQMSRVLDRININVNGDVMKLRVGSDDTNKFKKITNLEKAQWKSGSRKQRKNFRNPRIIQNFTRQKMKKINETSMEKKMSYKPSKFIENRRVSSNNFDRESSVTIHPKNRQTTDNYKIDSAENSLSKNADKISFEQENEIKSSGNNVTSKYSHTDSGSNYLEKRLEKLRNFFFHTDKITSRPPINRNMQFHRLANNKNLENWYQSKYANNDTINNSRIIVAPAIIPSARIPPVYAYPSITPQLHPRIIFQPGLNEFRLIDRINNVADKPSILNGEYLPKGTLSRIVGSEHKNQHFPQKSDLQSQFFQQRSGNSSRADNNYPTDRDKTVEKFKNPNIDNSTIKMLKSVDIRDGIENKNDEWQNNYDDREKLETGNSNDYANQTNIDRFDDDEFENSREDYVSKPILSSAHRLGKALELSHFNKFRQTPMNYLSLKHVVTRSLKNNEILKKFVDLRRKGRGSDNDRGREEIVKNLESLKDEPSIVSLRMILNPEKNVARISRQSIDSLEMTKNPQMVELRLKFSGNEKKSKLKSGKIYSEFFSEQRRKIVNFSTIGNRTFNGTNKYDTIKKLPTRFLDKIRRRAMLNKLREKIKFGKKNYPILYNAKSKNGTTIVNPRDRKSRTIIMEKNRKNSIEEKKSKKYSGVRHYLASSLRSFEDKNLTKKSNTYGKDFGIDWSGQAASLFTDLRESNDELTLYIDLTLGRVGTKSQRNRKPKT